MLALQTFGSYGAL